jgi:integrating conjugative element protein (TIGR03765 family)
LVGADDRSKRWLERHRSRLLQLNAIGLLVQAESSADLEAIAAIANGLPITPASGAGIAKALSVSHYPLAISDGRIWQ